LATGLFTGSFADLKKRPKLRRYETNSSKNKEKIMNAENPQHISVIDPIGPAIERVQLILFKPFVLSKWFIIGFCAWLAILGEGGGGGGGGKEWKENRFDPGFHALRESIVANLAIIIFVAAIVIPLLIILMLVFCWLRSRGQFMFVHCIAGNKAEIAVPWNKFSHHGNSLFLFRIVYGIIFCFAIGIPIAIAIIAGIALCATGFNPAAIAGMIGTIFVAVVVFILFLLVVKFTTDFVVPIMLLNTSSVIAGWKLLLSLMARHKAQMVLYILFQIVIWLVISFIVLLIYFLGFCCCCLSCCISILLIIPIINLAILYIVVVILLPLITFKRAYSLYYLRQFGPQFDVFSTQPA